MSSPEPERQETLITLAVPPGYRASERLDVYITSFVLNATRAKVQKAIKEGCVTVDGQVVRKGSYRVSAGEEILCRVMRPPPIAVIPQDLPLDIVYEDAYLVVVNKAAGMVVHPAYGNRDGTLVNALLYHLGSQGYALAEGEAEDAETVGLSTVNARPSHAEDPSIRPGIVHRLDKDTTGLMVVAKDNVTHVGLARQFEQRTIRRRYEALVWGVPDPPAGRIETALGRDPRDRKRMAVVRPAQGKQAITHYETLEALVYAARMRFRLETGRTHQIRVHARHLGHPILGDPTYDGQVIRYGPDTGKRRAFYKNLFERLPRQALHAETLGFRHPRTQERLDFTAEMPADMQYVWERLQAVEGGREQRG